VVGTVQKNGFFGGELTRGDANVTFGLDICNVDILVIELLKLFLIGMN
jgi:hypothetical protein